ncbi:hypothetical protein B0I37DRAFT_22315 [Chaetomium sp. MPI-CAGE-AT-0009]|nr:hypothetical protein B0I37DRAFT_22315 [Chaetomium sp. MPI-CAGE-AT-0009]
MVGLLFLVVDVGPWMLAGKLQENASCRRLRAEEAGDGDLLLGQTGLSGLGHITEFFCSVPSYVLAQNAGLQASSATWGPGGPGQPRPRLGGAGRRWIRDSGFQRSMAGLGDWVPEGHAETVTSQAPDLCTLSNRRDGRCLECGSDTWTRCMLSHHPSHLSRCDCSDFLDSGDGGGCIRQSFQCAGFPDGRTFVRWNSERMSGSHQLRLSSTDGWLRPNNRAKLGLDRYRGGLRRGPLSSATTRRGKPQLTKTCV